MLKMLMGYEAPVIDYPFAPSDVAMYHAAVSGPDSLDDHTWRDLLLERYAERLGRDTSIFGRQMLHGRLRGAAASAESIARVRLLVDDGATRERLHQACGGLRAADADVAGLLFGEGPPPSPRWSRCLALLPLVFLASLAGAFFWAPGWIVAVALWLALMAMQTAYYQRAQDWERLVTALQQQLRVHSLVGALPADAAVDACVAALRPDASLAGKASRKLGRSPLARAMPGVKEYNDWIWLSNIRHYYASRDAFLALRGFLRGSYLLVANLEADIALARHLGQAPRFCWAGLGESGDCGESAESGGDGAIALDGVVHPLLDEATPLTLELRGRGAFISGQNGVGKSTLLRTIGLNLVTARAFGFCYADAASVPPLPVYSSMQSEDSLAGGESLYIAELRRARELLALAAKGPALFIIDEIFRGTNHLESVSAAAAVLDTLARSGTVLVSSHNLVLAPLLEHALAPLCVGEEGGRLRVRPGVLARTNGIALLAERGFGPAIESKALSVHNWLSDYLAHPSECGHVLSEV
ncbi:MutS-related protein [Pseudoduganella namucuonensis]|uniref:MutS domain V n=1 Tax=Pseudoduganella namucuonensis TaxID=1035707 RepID=A0A1I7LD57_9BURK|nr:DNA mismatch repair protein MutS [Pseudoduganella namucuonensis]SFV07617.1 MutS domain V [Pseudoduganella namucuonensis]